jgi:hypothetical protein
MVLIEPAGTTPTFIAVSRNPHELSSAHWAPCVQKGVQMSPLDEEIEAWFAQASKKHDRKVIFGFALAAGLAVGAYGAAKLMHPPTAKRAAVMRLDPVYVSAPREAKQTLISAAASAER